MPFPSQQPNSFGNDAYVRINPSSYLHTAISNAMGSLQAGLTSGQKETGFILLILNVDQLEKVAMAKEILPENDKDYAEKVFNYQKEKGLKSDDLNDQARLANYKLYLLLAKVFSTLPRSTTYKMEMKNLPLKEKIVVEA